jgi:osmotically-inducible protein OsmY
MKLQTRTTLTLLLLTLVLGIAACAPALETETESATRDEQIRIRVAAVIAQAADLPQQIAVEVREGIVFISGSLDCEGCGGLRTPGNIGTVQQSLGAMVRAVTGVNEVVFDLNPES